MLEQALPDHFRAFADTVERDGGHTYPAICRGVADDAVVLALLELAPPLQRRPLLLMASVHYLLLAGAEHPLAGWYDTVATLRGTAPVTPGTGDVAAAFADFCTVHRAELARLLRTRSTQTNEVGRCTGLLPAFCHIAATQGGRTTLNLLDLGASAGLNLLFDDYAYAYRSKAEDTTLHAGHPGSRVVLSCDARPGLRHLPPLEVPAIAERVGLDLAPVDPRSDDGALWLLACQWPDNPARFERLRGALANVRASPRPPRLERGDMIDDLPRVAAGITATGPLVVFHSWVAAYLDEQDQRALAEVVQALGRRRPVHHLYCEAPYETPGLPTPPAPIRREGPDLATAIVHIGPDGAPPVRLADTHPHGFWIRWWPPDLGDATVESGEDAGGNPGASATTP